MPIRVPRNEPFFTNRTCLKFVRTQEVMNENCTVGEYHIYAFKIKKRMLSFRYISMVKFVES